MKKEVLAHVHPEFRKILKRESADKGMSIIKYTEHLARRKSLEEEFNEAKKKGGFNFRF